MIRPIFFQVFPKVYLHSIFTMYCSIQNDVKLLLPLFLWSNLSIILKNVIIYFRSGWHHWTQSPMVAHFDIFGPLFLAWNWSHFCHVQAETWLWFWSFIWRSESRACYVALPLKHNSFIQSINHSFMYMWFNPKKILL